MKKLLSSLAIVAMLCSFATGMVSAQSLYKAGAVGVNASYPNCGETIPDVAFGVIGVNDATGYTENPCLASEATFFNGKNTRSLYVFTGWYAQSSHINPFSPRRCGSANEEDCLAYNYGFNAGLYAYNYAESQHISAPTWWLDVESSASWATDTIQNRNSLQGEYDFLASKGIAVGVYSTTDQWDSITGTWKNGWPSWGATTWTTAKQAETYCTGHEFTGGQSLLMQYIPTDSDFDYDVAC